MIGTDLPYVRDRVTSPTAGEVPGVYLHAMALDNLMNQGSKYQRRPDELERQIEEIVGAFLVAALAITLPGLAAWLLRLRGISVRIRKYALFRFGAFFATLAVSVLVMFGIATLAASIPAATGTAPLPTCLLWMRNITLNPLFITLAVMIPLIEQLSHEFFPHYDVPHPKN